MKLVYKCKQDGDVCNKEVPKLDETGELISPKKLNNPKISNDFAWDVCSRCERNHTISGACYGKVEIWNKKG